MLWTRKGMTWISSKSTVLLSIPQNGMRNICGCNDLFRLFVPLSLVDRQFLHPWERPHHSLSKLQESTRHGEHRWRALTAARAEETPQNVPQLRSEHGESISAQRRPTEHRSQATVHTGTAVLAQPKPAQASSTPWLLRIYLSYSEKHRDSVLIKQSKVVVGIKEYLLYPISISPFPAIT